MTRVLLLALVLVGCGPSLESPAEHLTSEDRAELERMRSLWVAQGLQDPGRCGADALIVYPASDRDVLVWCHAKPCGTQGPTGRCVDACQTSQFDSPWERTPLLIVQKRQPRESWRHEMGHLWQSCVGLPTDHSADFQAWLEQVECPKP